MGPRRELPGRPDGCDRRPPAAPPPTERGGRFSHLYQWPADGGIVGDEHVEAVSQPKEAPSRGLVRGSREGIHSLQEVNR